MGIPAPSSNSEKLGVLAAQVMWPLCYLRGSFLKSQVGYLNNRVRTLEHVQAVTNQAFLDVTRHKDDWCPIYSDKKKIGEFKVVPASYPRDEIKTLVRDMQTQKENFNKNEFVDGFLGRLSWETYRTEHPKKEACSE